jgi:hypothetical protein
MSDTSDESSEETWDDEPLKEHPHDGEMPSDTDVQAERQEPLGH